jgi:hypothetical protein
LKESYKLLADTCHAIVAPVGEAFRTCIAYDSTVNLYQADYSHPSLNGSFLAASVFYNVFFHRSANGNAYDPGVTQLPAYMFHLLARQTVKDSLNCWNLGIYEPWAEFDWNEAPGCNGEFFGNSNANFSHYWDFGDSTTSVDPNPVHHYLYSRYYPVLHIVYNSCSSDTFLLYNNMVCNGATINEYLNNQFQVYPNPADERISISRLQSDEITVSIYNSIGELMLRKMFAGSIFEIGIHALPEGIYYLYMADGKDFFSAGKFTIAR